MSSVLLIEAKLQVVEQTTQGAKTAILLATSHSRREWPVYMCVWWM